MAKGKLSVMIDGLRVMYPQNWQDDFELFECLAEMEENPLYLMKALRRIFEPEMLAKIKEQAKDTDDGHVSTEKMSEFLGRFFDAVNAKNS